MCGTDEAGAVLIMDATAVGVDSWIWASSTTGTGSKAWGKRT